MEAEIVEQPSVPDCEDRELEMVLDFFNCSECEVDYEEVEIDEEEDGEANDTDEPFSAFQDPPSDGASKPVKPYGAVRSIPNKTKNEDMLKFIAQSEEVLRSRGDHANLLKLQEFKRQYTDTNIGSASVAAGLDIINGLDSTFIWWLAKFAINNIDLTQFSFLVSANQYAMAGPMEILHSLLCKDWLCRAASRRLNTSASGIEMLWAGFKTGHSN